MLKPTFIQNPQPNLAPVLGLIFDIVFQPIVNTATNEIFGYEALARSNPHQGAEAVLAQLTDANKKDFDMAVCARAMLRMQNLQLKGMLNINLLPNAYAFNQQHLRQILNLADTAHISPSNMMFEMTKGERFEDIAYYQDLFKMLKKDHFLTAIDHFGSGFASIKLLNLLKPDVVKIDIKLVRNIETDKHKQAVVAAIVKACECLDIQAIAIGVETAGELETLKTMRVGLFQGFLFSAPII
jgi:EAL domain-containing protein (putative c-di-GMP-specific phosphodiesterase class I)